MIVETSAVVAMMMEERGFEVLVSKMSKAGTRSLSVAGYVEASMVLSRLKKRDVSKEIDEFLAVSLIEIVPVTVTQGQVARAAFLQYGKGRHPAGLNFGDCFSYALAKSLRQPLLFVGNDFSQTDIVPA